MIYDVLYNILIHTSDPRTLKCLRMTNKFLNTCLKNMNFWNIKYEQVAGSQYKVLPITKDYFQRYENLLYGHGLTNKIFSFCLQKKHCVIEPYLSSYHKGICSHIRFKIKSPSCFRIDNVKSTKTIVYVVFNYLTFC